MAAGAITRIGRARPVAASIRLDVEVLRPLVEGEHELHENVMPTQQRDDAWDKADFGGKALPQDLHFNGADVALLGTSHAAQRDWLAGSQVETQSIGERNRER
jgi:hypothetical protein